MRSLPLARSRSGNATCCFLRCKAWEGPRCPKLFFAANSADMIRNMVQRLLDYCHNPDSTVSLAGHALIGEVLCCSLQTVRRMVAESMFSHLQVPAAFDADAISWQNVMLCMRHVPNLVRALDPSARCKWVTLLCQILMAQRNVRRQVFVITMLDHLWKLEQAPCKTYAGPAAGLARMKSSRFTPQRVRSMLKRLLLL